MISKIAIGITTLLSVLGSAPVVASSSTSPYDPQSTNVYYDLAVLYGDSNKDGSVTDDEYLNFQINSLAPSGKVGENTSYKYLGTMPYYVNELYLYLFSATRIDDCILNDRGQVDFDSSSYSYLLDYQNSSTQNPVTGEWIDDSVKSSSLKLVNYYHSNKGYYYKFSIPDYLAVRSEDNTYRFKPRNLRVLDVGGKLKQSFDFGASNENELLYDSNCHSSSAPYVFFSEKTYEIKAVMDLWLAPNASKVDYDKGFYFLPINKTENIVSAYEIFYVFFFFDGDFHPDEVKSVTYSASVDEYQVTQVEKVISATGVYPSVTQDIYCGTIDSYQEETVDKYSSSLSLISSNQITGTTSAEIKKIDQTFDCDTWWNHDQMTTSYSWKSIVLLDEVEKIQSNQDENWEP